MSHIPTHWKRWDVTDKMRLRDVLREQVMARHGAETVTEETLPHFLQRVSPDYHWDWPYMRLMQSKLDAVTRGDIKKLMLFLPPRHGKSELATVRYPAYRLHHDPSTRIVVAAYGQGLAERFSRKCRAICALDLGPTNRDRFAAVNWSTKHGDGGLRAVGVGGGVTGMGFDLLIIDDPVKSREEAESIAYRSRVWEWYCDDLSTRREPGAAMILIMTRWHQDDLAGRILASDDGPNWDVVCLPAEAEDNDPLGRAPGEALCPDRFNLDDLAERRRVLGPSYAALFQQRPVARGGGMFKRDWFDLVPACPQDARRVRYWDKAATEGGGDYTVGVLMARGQDGIFYVEDVVRGQWSSGARERVMRQTAELDAERYEGVITTIDADGEETKRQRPRVEIWVEQEGGSGGVDSARNTMLNLAGFVVSLERPSGTKEVRAEPFAAQAEAGNVRVVRGPWTSAYLDELTTFPAGTHDDQVDASSGAFNKLALTSRTLTRAASLYD